MNGWDDPRMPTLSGMRRRGVPPSALRLFCEQVGISKADSNIDFKVLEDCIRDEMDKTCRRAFCVLKPLKVTITNFGKFVQSMGFKFRATFASYSHIFNFPLLL